jgi:Flp pilus assembly protein TadG
MRIAHTKRRDGGQILVILALAIAALLGVAALGIDAFYMYWNKNRLQSATDAAALAGATYLGNASFSGKNSQCTYATDAQNAACTYALTNGVALGEIQSVTLGSAKSITVTTARTVSALFAKVFGYTSFTLGATATAAVQALGASQGAVPIGLDSKTPYTYGQSITMHQSGCGSGCWQGLALPSYSSGSSGGSAFRDNLASGCNCTINIGDLISSEPGAANGPTRQGVSQRVAAGQSVDPAGTWDNHTSDDPRAATVPLVNWNGCSGSCTVPVTGFAEVWISGSSGSDISAVFIRQLAPGQFSASAPDGGAYHAVLLQ